MFINPAIKAFIRSVCKKKSRHGGSIILRVFHLPTRTQLNAAHAQLNKKIKTGHYDVFMGNSLISNELLDRIL